MSKKEEVRFSSYTSPVIQIVKYIDKESSSGAPMYDLYLDNKREQRYTDINKLLYRLELIMRLSGVNGSGVFAEGSSEYDMRKLRESNDR